MIYDHQVNMSEVHAPVQANVIIRSQSGQNSKRQPQRYTSASARNKNSESRKTFGAMNGQRFDIEKHRPRGIGNIRRVEPAAGQFPHQP